MPVKIRLMRIGARQRPFYRVVAVDERKKRTGGYLELLGTYNPLTEPKEINLQQDKIDAWMKKGAQPSDGFLRIIGKAKQRPPRKPKKEKKETPAQAAPAEEAAAAPVTETVQEENAPVTTSEETAPVEAEAEKTQEIASPAEPDRNDNRTEAAVEPEAEKTNTEESK